MAIFDPSPTEGSLLLEYYQECWHARLWTGEMAASRAMHCGLFDAPDDDPARAQQRLDEHLAALAGLGAGAARVLDAGCGAGASAIHLLRRHPALQVTGVNLSREQVWLARQLSDAAGLGDRALYVVRDYADTGLSGEAFDVVLSVDSLGHCGDRPRFAREAFRLLVPGGRLVISDAFRTTRPLTALESACYEALLRGLALADCYAQPPEEVFGAAGFVAPFFEDLTARALPGMQRAAERASVMLQNVQLSPLRRGHERALVALHALCRSGALCYGAFRALKPEREGKT